MVKASGMSSARDTPKEIEGPPHVREEGFTQVDGQPKDHKFIADVVFVHGLQGHPKRTWQSKPRTKPKKGFHERIKGLSISGHHGQKGKTHVEDGFFWPAELLPQDFNNVRILTYGYDSKVTKAFKGPTSKDGIFQHGKSFLGALKRVRFDCGDRPIIFVAHSLGGLIVKQALIEARKRKEEPSLLSVYENTHAVIFFGTPHRGSGVASWARLLSAVAQAAQMDTSNAILIDLDPESGSSKLEELRLDFDDILRDSQRARELRVFSFQEAKGMRGINLLGNKVVPNESSSLDSRRYNDSINANHMGMCRFEDENDDGYQNFKGVLAGYIAEIVGQKQSAVEVSLENDEARRAELLQSLDFAERRSRNDQLQNIDAKEGTFSWVWSPSSSFTDWLSNHERLYWIYGKPGSGKSTLINYLMDRDQTKFKLQESSQMDWIVLHFFFDFRGGKGITNNFEGLLRSLLHQLIEKIPQIGVLDLDYKKQESFPGWQEHRLRDALRTSIHSIEGGVCIFVDGLDEYEGKVLQLIQFLKGLTSSIDDRKTRIKVCVSSRPEPVPFQLLQDLPNTDISYQNKSGIRSYCFLTLNELEPMVREGLDISRLSETIAERAEGVFLWARFALDELIQGHIDGESFEEASVRLKSIPSDLESLYDRMLSRMRPLDKKECLVMLQLVCFAERTLSWEDHLVATKIAMGVESVVEHVGSYQDLAAASNSRNTFTKRLRAKAVGLLEVVNTNERFPTTGLKLVHKSVGTYLDQKGWQVLGDSETYNRAKHESFYIETCTRYLDQFLRHCELKNIPISNDYGDRPLRDGTNEHLSETWPFLRYAGMDLFEHARSLERSGVSSYPLLSGFSTRKLISVHLSAQYRLLCTPCYIARKVFDESFEMTHVAFLHGLVLYCKDDLTSRRLAPGPEFWGRALTCAISYSIWDAHLLGGQELVSLALQKVDTVERVHIKLFKGRFVLLGRNNFKLVESVLRHESVRNLRLADKAGQKITLLWFFAGKTTILPNYLSEYLNLLIEVSDSRGEDVRQRCGPEGNLVETLLKQRPDDQRRQKLRILCEYYESKSWPFEYDADEVDREE